MDDETFKRWLTGQQRGKFGTIPAHSDILYELFRGTKSPDEAAQALIEDVCCSKYSDRPWRVWQLIYISATELPQYHDAVVDLICAIHKTKTPNPDGTMAINRLMLDIWPYWRDHFDGLKTHAHLRQKFDVEPIIPLSGHEKLINFTNFSAKLLSKDAAFVDAIGVFGFFELRDLLECTRESYCKELLIDENVTTIPEARSVDLEAACLWILTGGRAFREMGNSSMEGFEDGYRMETDYWTSAEGISEQRWRLWRARLGGLAKDSELSVRARDAALRAAEAIDSNG